MASCESAMRHFAWPRRRHREGIKLDIEGEEAVVAPQLPEAFPHPELVVALEARDPVVSMLQPFADTGFHIYDLHNDYLWPFQRKRESITPAAYSDFHNVRQADVLLSRKPYSGFGVEER